MIIASLIMVLDKVRITNGALMMILGGSWRNESAGQGRQRVNTLTGGKIRGIKKSSLCSQTINGERLLCTSSYSLGILSYCLVLYGSVFYCAAFHDIL